MSAVERSTSLQASPIRPRPSARGATRRSRCCSPIRSGPGTGRRRSSSYRGMRPSATQTCKRIQIATRASLRKSCRRQRKGQPKFLLRRFAFYYARIWIEITPLRIRRWADRELSTQPHEWRLDPAPQLPSSDPEPPGRQPPPWKDIAPDWREQTSRALRELPLADLTAVDGDGYPVCVPVSAGALAGDELALQLGAGAPSLPDGPACLTVHGHDEHFTSQENHTLVGSLRNDSGSVTLHVERALANWSITGNRAKIAIDFLRNGRRLAPRLKAEAARRGQPVPRVNIP